MIKRKAALEKTEIEGIKAMKKYWLSGVTVTSKSKRILIFG
jgi:hypothetical protein